MTPLPFEQAFRSWMAEREMAWEPLELTYGERERTSGYRLRPADEGRGTVVALHGAGNDALFAWVGLFKRFLLRGFEIFTFDLPGHGRANETRLDLAGLDRSIRAAVACAAEDLAGRPVHAVGVSLGGSALLHSLPALEHRLASAAVMVAPLRIRFGVATLWPELGLRSARALWRERRHYGLTGLIPSFGHYKRDVYPLRLATPPPPGAFGYVRALNLMLAEMSLVETVADVSLPVLLVYGERDAIVPIEQGERLARALANAELAGIPGGTHLSTLLEEGTVERVVRWVEEHS